MIGRIFRIRMSWYCPDIFYSSIPIPPFLLSSSPSCRTFLPFLLHPFSRLSSTQPPSNLQYMSSQPIQQPATSPPPLFLLQCKLLNPPILPFQPSIFYSHPSPSRCMRCSVLSSRLVYSLQWEAGQSKCSVEIAQHRLLKKTFSIHFHEPGGKCLQSLSTWIHLTLQILKMCPVRGPNYTHQEQSVYSPATSQLSLACPAFCSPLLDHDDLPG